MIIDHEPDLDATHAFLSLHAYWCRGIPRDTLKRALDGSLCFAVKDGGAQIGFARVVTDFATFAYLADVYVLPEHRGRGVSKVLLDAVHAHPRLQGLRRWMLATRDAHGLYRQYGWRDSAAGRLMEKIAENPYGAG